ncbi:LamG-like jellyroll fold domain-containing protein [Streptomyces sp. JJ36]|uniref:LamG-like jellyroll fold domain-containing protein n=1 Tax=Streptomyces sp. JJ36 TaxID=2736645 RepID=UPI001F318283|nr:LamG-like jellyroll fold domain-containing protein [Streptomyces sp. JJ36]MCF6523100.1 LamG domain-containing protein [Streptomyces sp. JJ36]
MRPGTPDERRERLRTPGGRYRTGLLRTATVATTVLGLLGAGLAGFPGRQTPTVAAASQETPDASPRPTEELATLAARRTGEQVEVAGLRGERREVFANPDGTFTAREYSQPVRTRQNGTWVPVDDTLVRRADGAWAPKAATVELEFSDGGSGPFARMRKAGREFSLSWPGGELPEPQVEGDTATYENVLPDVDLVARADVDGLRHLLVVKTPQAAENPELGRIELGLDTAGLDVRETGSGTLRAVDSAVGGTVFESGRPAMWDSSAVAEQTQEPAGAAPAGPRTQLRRADPAGGTPAVPADRAELDGPGGGGRTAPLDVEITDDTVALVPDQALLTGADTVFPVVIDPAHKTTSRSAWTGVMSGYPDSRDWKYSGSAGMGRCPTDYSPQSCNGVGVRRLLYTMPVSPYSGKQILKATFSARVAHVYWADARAEPVRLYRIGGKNHTVTSSSDWGNTKDDWDDYLGTVDQKISPTSCSSQANLHFEGGELTSEVQAAADGGWSSLSLGLRAADESTFGGWKRICGNTYLSVTYNNPPRQVDHRLMSSSPGGACVWGSGRPAVDEPPRLHAEARDPDHTSSRTDKVKMQFKVVWTDGSGTEQSYTYDTSYKAPNPGTVFSHTVRSTIPENTVIYWTARAYDGHAWGDWSWAGTPQRCEFVYDSTRPGAPAVGSEQYPDDQVWHHGVGTAGTFTFAPDTDDAIPDEDVVEYRYSFDGEAYRTVTPATAGGSASVTFTPLSSGRHWVTVESLDQAGNSSTAAQYEFLVTDGAPVTGQWNLADPPGSTDAHDESGRFPASPGSGVTFGVPGPGGGADDAVRLDGGGGAYLDAGATVVDTDASFSVSAWVRPASLDRDMTVVSQDGSGEPGFVLGYDAAAGSWSFSVPVSDVTSLGHWGAAADVTPVADQWVLLTGVYDAYAAGGPELRLYVNEQLQATATRRTHWTGYGSLQIGRSLAKSGYRDHFHGDLAEVRAFDRVLPADQVAELMTVRPERTGYWPLDAATDGASANVQTGGEALTLQGGAAIYQPADPLFDEAALVGDGHLTLDGVDAHAATAGPPVGGDASFTVAARAQLTALDPERSQTVLSLPGAAADRFAVRYQASTGRWELAVAQEDAAGAAVTTVSDDQQLPDTGGSGQHLAVVYDAFANELRLYVEGQLAASARTSDDTLWRATGGLQVGRTATGGGQYFAGALDEVRAYRGAADLTAVQRMAQLTSQPQM